MKYPILLPNIFNYPFTYESDLNLKIGLHAGQGTHTEKVQVGKSARKK